MNPVPRMPYGLAKRIVAAMAIGDTATVRPQYLVAFHNAARRMGVRIVTTSFRRDGRMLHRILRVAEDWKQTGHAIARMPHRNGKTGRWLKDQKEAA